MKYLLVFLMLLVTGDGVLTHFLLEGGLAREGNPLLEPLVGDIGFVILKGAGACICVFILWDIYRRFPKVAVMATWCFVVAYSLIVLWNTSLFIRV